MKVSTLCLSIMVAFAGMATQLALAAPSAEPQPTAASGTSQERKADRKEHRSEMTEEKKKHPEKYADEEANQPKPAATQGAKPKPDTGKATNKGEVPHNDSAGK